MAALKQRAARWAVLVGITATAWAAHAQVRPEISSRGVFTEGEWALLPAWCIDSQQGPFGSPEGAGYNKSPRAPQWVALMGSDFWHMHHFCRGLTDQNRLQRADLSPRERLLLMDTAITEFRYVISNCKPTMPLMPEAFLRMGDVHLMRGDLPDASAAFEQARKLKPDYWPAYSRWAEVLIGLKQMEQARALLIEGLAHSPQQPVLLQKLRLAGGTPPRVVAAAPAPAQKPPSTQAEPIPFPAATAGSPATTPAVPAPAASSPP